MMQQMSLSPCNNLRVNAVMTRSIPLLPNNTADRGFKRSTFMPQCHGMRKKGYGTGRFCYSPINIGVLARASVRAAGCCTPPLTLCMVPHPRCAEWEWGFAIESGVTAGRPHGTRTGSRQEVGEGGGVTVCNQLMNGNHPLIAGVVTLYLVGTRAHIDEEG